MNSIPTIIVILNVFFTICLIIYFQSSVTFVRSKELAKKVLDQIDIEQCSVVRKTLLFHDAYIVYCNHHRFFIYNCEDETKQLLEEKSIKIYT